MLDGTGRVRAAQLCVIGDGSAPPPAPATPPSPPRPPPASPHTRVLRASVARLVLWTSVAVGLSGGVVAFVLAFFVGRPRRRTHADFVRHLQMLLVDRRAQKQLATALRARAYAPLRASMGPGFANALLRHTFTDEQEASAGGAHASALRALRADARASRTRGTLPSGRRLRKFFIGQHVPMSMHFFVSGQRMSVIKIGNVYYDSCKTFPTTTASWRNWVRQSGEPMDGTLLKDAVLESTLRKKQVKVELADTLSERIYTYVYKHNMQNAVLYVSVDNYISQRLRGNYSVWTGEHKNLVNKHGMTAFPETETEAKL